MTDKKKQPSKDITADEKPKADNLAAAIGRRLSQARSGLSLSQQAVSTRSAMLDADGVGISRATLSLYETGTNKPGAREILLLCEVLSISPNWLLFGSESPARSLQPTTLFLAGDDLDISSRLAIAILALNPTDRDSIANIVFSMITSKLGDVKLAAMMMMAQLLKDGLQAEVLGLVGKDAKGLPLDQLIEKFIEKSTTGHGTNWGTLRPPITDEQFENDDFTPQPPRNLKSDS
ncbi:MAG: helix-turn-helix transcriptional regulator [Gallionella sp.]|nr:helix-turn-helix transcriptional regulator [Gallionella sp.]